jgi:hypothetical protein
MKSAIIKVETAKQNTERQDIKDELNEHEAEFSELIKSFIDQLTSGIEDSISEPDNLQIDDSGKNWTETCAEMYMSNELNVPTFDGESTNWKSYWQQFEAAIHKSTKLTNQLRMQYLQKITRDAIEGIDATAEGYPEAIEALKARLNCLKGGIQSSSVHLKYSCLSCGKKHHTLLYLDVENRQPISTNVPPPNVPPPNVPPPNVPPPNVPPPNVPPPNVPPPNVPPPNVPPPNVPPPNVPPPNVPPPNVPPPSLPVTTRQTSPPQHQVKIRLICRPKAH